MGQRGLRGVWRMLGSGGEAELDGFRDGVVHGSIFCM